MADEQEQQPPQQEPPQEPPAPPREEPPPAEPPKGDPPPPREERKSQQQPQQQRGPKPENQQRDRQPRQGGGGPGGGGGGGGNNKPAGDRGPRPGGGGGGERREGGGPRPGGDRGGFRPDGPMMDIDLEKLIADSLYLDNQAHAVVSRLRDMDSGTKSQLRRFYNAVRRACRTPEGERQHAFVMLRARLAYTIARHSLRSMDALEKLLLQVTRKNSAPGYERFRDLFEAIVAYNE
jgi:CRISPR type III-A-associated protein Csm2